MSQAAPTITWPTPTGISYGTLLSATQLDATASAPGTFVYTPPSGTILDAGSQTLSVIFTPDDATDYSTVTQTVMLTVSMLPTISSLNQTSGAVGTAITITGVNFGATQGTSTVTFNGLTATPSSWSDSFIVTAVPVGATSGSVLVTVAGLASNAVSFTVSSATPLLVQHVSQSSTQSNAVTSYQIRLPNATQGGNCLIVGVHSDSSGAIPTVRDDQGNTYTQIVTNGDGLENLTLFVAFQIAAGTQNITVSFSSATRNVAGLASEFYNVATSSALDVSNAGSGSGTTITSGSFTPVASGDLIYQFSLLDGISNPISSFTQASSWNLLSADVKDSMAAQYQVQTTAAAITPIMFISPGNGWNSVAMALKSGPSGSTIPGIHVVHLQHNSLGANASTPVQLQFPSTGNLIVVSWIGGAGSDITNIADGNGNLYTQIGTAFGNGDSGDNQVFYAANATTGPAMMGPVLTTAGTPSFGSTVLLFDITGASSSPFDATVGLQTASGSQTSSGTLVGVSITPGTPTELVISSIGVANGGISGVSPGYFVSSTSTPETSPSPNDHDNGWAVDYASSGNPQAFAWTTLGGPVGNWASTAVAFAAGLTQVAPIVTWASPSAINYGTPLSAAQLNATANFPGTFVYTPPLGTLPSAGLQTLSVTFTPTDTTNYTIATQTVALTVGQATPAITWAAPTAINYGTALSGVQLDATANVPGTLTYTPPFGTILGPGSQLLSVTFTPADTTDYAVATQTVSLTVGKAMPTITWPTVAAINYGTPLNATQLNATASVPGTFVYTPSLGTVLGAGTQTLSVTFTPTDTTDYATVTQTVTLTVGQAVLTVTATNGTRGYGTANPPFSASFTGFVNGDTPSVLDGSAALSTTATVGSPVGSYAITAGLGTLAAANYSFNLVNGTLTVSQAAPTITWATPTGISYGSPLSAAQLDATINVPGTFVYTPVSGTVLGAGSQTLSTTFTPTDTIDYTSAAQTVTLSVGKATPAITWATPTAITYGTPLSTTQLNATANVPGTFIYTPPLGTVLASGSQLLSTTFTPSDNTDYTTAPQTVMLTINSPPVVSNLSPSAGTAGTAVTITGTGFGATQGNSTVTFNSLTAMTSSWSATSIVASVPAGVVTGNVTVTVGGQPSNGVLFTVLVPSIASLSPTSGSSGTSVAINGANFGTTQGASIVKFNGTTATPTSWSTTKIVAPVPLGTITGSVTVTVSGQTSNGATFTVSAPAITSLSPTSGSSGTSVTINGANFGTTQGASIVKFNGTTATSTSWSTTKIVAPVPLGTITGSVTVTVSGQTSNGVTFTVSAPAITSLSPTSGSSGTSVTINGTNFGTTQGASTVAFNGTTATSTSWSTTKIVAPVPLGTITGSVTVTVSGQTSNGATFTVSAPAITSLSPTSGSSGTSVTINGANFGTTQGASIVKFNGTMATPTSWSTTRIVVPVPLGTNTGSLTVTVSGQTSNGVTFTVSAPAITGLSPTSGSSGTSVTINGTNFGTTQSASTIAFNGTTATSTSWSTTKIVAPVPLGTTTGSVIVTVNGQTSNGVSFTVAPLTTNLSPAFGAVGTSVTITGANFGATKGTSTVKFNGTIATPTSWTSTTILAPVPTGATTGNVVVTVGTLASNGINFFLPPTITRLLPISGAAGASVTVTGTNFGSTQGSSTIAFNGTPTIPTSWTGTSILAAVPSGATTGNVVVTVGGVASNGVGFTVTPPPIAISVSPQTVSLQNNQTQPFTATVQNDSQNQGVIWSLSGAGCSGATCGGLTSVTSTAATYTAPGIVPSPATVTLTTSSVTDNTKMASATITVTAMGISVSISPTRGSLTTSQRLSFVATLTNDTQNQGVSWTATGTSCTGIACGTLTNMTTAATTYNPPATPGVYTVTATSVADITKSASTTIGVSDIQGVFSWHGTESDTSRQGVNSKEYSLSASNVRAATFGKLFSCAVDGFVYAEPLYASNLSIPGKGTHNVVFVATENDSLYAFDADDPSCTSVWSTGAISLLPANETHVTSGDVNSSNIGPLVGITGTPAIDPSSSTLYAVAASKNANTNTFIQRLHAIDLSTGQEKFGGPVLISAQLPGQGTGNFGGMMSFNPRTNNQRPGLLLLNGVVYIAWASHDDTPIYEGWVIGYNATTLQQVAAFTPDPDGTASHGQEGGIWMSGAAPAADSSGNIYLSVGNGTFDDSSSTLPAVAPNDNFGDSALKLLPAGNTLTVADFYTPPDQSNLNTNDYDLGGAGIVLFNSGGSSFLLTAGKDGNIYLLNQNQLGRYKSGAGEQDAALQNFNVIDPTGFRSSPAFFNNTVYLAGLDSPLFAIPFDTLHNVLALPPYQSSEQSNETYGGYGTTPAISAQGSANGIAWVIDVGPETGTPSVHAVLRAYDAANLKNLLYASPSSGSQAAGLAVKFTVPTVANGKVYLGTQTELDVYGLLPN